ncbi:Scopoletin glucosyltransferase-like protein [Drosera capensis]
MAYRSSFPFQLELQDKVQRGKKAAIDEHDCLKWLDSREPDSVIYLSFRSIARFPVAQLHDIALLLKRVGDCSSGWPEDQRMMTQKGYLLGCPWPLFAEQFYNEKLITEVLKNDLPVGAKKWAGIGNDLVTIKKEAIVNAMRRIMDVEEGAAIRNRATELKELAGKAVEKGGSSYSDLHSLLHELSSYRASA